MMKKHLQAAGVQMTPEADVAVHIVIPPGYEPVEGKYNIMFTMYEGETIPPDWIPRLAEADMLVVPCRHNKRVFGQYFDGPIEVCPEGVDPNEYQYIDRKPPGKGEPFRFLWLGASNPRKGWEHASLAWAQWWDEFPREHEDSVLIFKTTQIEREERVVRMRGNVIMDTRDYSAENMLALYGISNCFLFPTMGEGWGLTLTEACATGLPAIYTPYSGVVDFMDRRYSYPVKYSMKSIGTIKTNDKGERMPYHTTVSASADIDSIVRKMWQVYHNYEAALEKGRKMSEIIRGRFTWAEAARRFIEIVESAKVAA